MPPRRNMENEAMEELRLIAQQQIIAQQIAQQQMAQDQNLLINEINTYINSYNITVDGGAVSEHANSLNSMVKRILNDCIQSTFTSESYNNKKLTEKYIVNACVHLKGVFKEMTKDKNINSEQLVIFRALLECTTDVSKNTIIPKLRQLDNYSEIDQEQINQSFSSLEFSSLKDESMGSDLKQIMQKRKRVLAYYIASDFVSDAFCFMLEGYMACKFISTGYSTLTTSENFTDVMMGLTKTLSIAAVGIFIEMMREVTSMETLMSYYGNDQGKLKENIIARVGINILRALNKFEEDIKSAIEAPAQTVGFAEAENIVGAQQQNI